MSSRGSSGKKIDYLNKRIPENPKYKHVKHAVDTGASITSYLEKVEEIKKNYKYRRDEIFKRIKVTTFAQLILQVAESELERDTSLTSQGSTSSGQDLITPQEDEKENEEPPPTARSTVSSLVCGIGELDVGSSQPPPPVQCQHHCTNLPYLLLDVRDRESYDQCHIIGAQSYPAVTLSRSCNYFTREILDFKNKPGKIIILYDEDEHIAPQAATTFVQREVDNIFMLSGGLKVLYKVFPDGMLTGQVPKTCYPSPPPSARKSLKTPVRSPPPTAIPSPAPHREYFTPDDLDSIQAKLDDALLSSDGGLSSRATSRSSTVASSRATTQSSSRPTSKPWK
ncbi:centrosomal protein of 41 kDa-like [Dysidea avara]|uniref:centrosomal protein of 41 kDa-like n=1 Tax=Dysidea avara TaxID=196820 RepID=UPI003320CF70